MCKNGIIIIYFIKIDKNLLVIDYNVELNLKIIKKVETPRLR